jgi:hypothetical protein
MPSKEVDEAFLFYRVAALFAMEATFSKDADTATGQAVAKKKKWGYFLLHFFRFPSVVLVWEHNRNNNISTILFSRPLSVGIDLAQ